MVFEFEKVAAVFVSGLSSCVWCVHVCSPWHVDELYVTSF